MEDYLLLLYTIFKTETKKEHNIIIIRVISSHMGPMYIETPYTIMSIETPYITKYIETPNI